MSDDQAHHDRLTIAQSWLADIPTPPDALPGTLTDWHTWDEGRYGRGYTIHTTAVPLPGDRQAVVRVEGWQLDDGTIDRTVVAEHINGELTPEQARAVAAALTAAAGRITD